MEGAARAEVEAARRAALGGDLEPARRWLEGAGDPSDAGPRAIRYTLLALEACADPASGGFAGPDELEPLSAAGDDFERALLACARGAILAREVEALERYAALSNEPGSLLHAWVAVARGDGARAEAIARARQATTDPADRIEATCLRALALARAGDVSGAREIARRASRMARTEDLPQSQYLSSLTLARVRRLGGAPHLALRILDSLALVAPEGWSGCLAWEMALAGRAPGGDGLEAASWRAFYDACGAGDLAGFAAAVEGLEECARRWPARALDVREAAGICDVGIDPTSLPPTLRDFVTGASDEVPGAISGLCCGAARVPSRVHVYVTAAGRGRRVAALAEPLARAVAGVTHEPARPGRTHEAIAVVALAGPRGIERDALFREVYGFDFVQVSHGNLLRVLLHRMRKWLDGVGELEVVDDRVVLELRRALLIPDMRCEYSLEERVLRSLSRVSHQSIRETAKQLGVPLRTAQEALQALREDGAVVERREGRRVQYRVEDTTFSEPTRWG